MNILAFDTCFDCCSVAAGRQIRSLVPSLAYATEFMATGHAERLMPMIEDVMRDARLSFDELGRIVVTHGPGTFTGARIAVSAARALSLATGAPVTAISSLHLMALHPALTSGGEAPFAIAMDARRGEVYVQVFDPHGLSPLTPPQLLSYAAAADLVAGVSYAGESAARIVAGSGAEAVAAEARRLDHRVEAVLPGLLPDAVDMLFVSFGWPVEDRVSTLYLRPPDAKPPRPSGLVVAPFDTGPMIAPSVTSTGARS